jgi:plasmid stability protein
VSKLSRIDGIFSAMPVNLSIENVPDEVVERLSRRAARNRRSLQDELLAIIEDAAGVEQRPNGVAEVLAEVRKMGLKTPREAAAIIRIHRDRR